MNLKEAHFKERSKRNGELIAVKVAKDPSLFDLNLQYIIDNNTDLQQRAAQVLGYCIEKHRFPVSNEQMNFLIDTVLTEGYHNSVYRNIWKCLELLSSLPENRIPEVLDQSFKVISDPKEKIAIRAFAIPVAYRICITYPELAREFKMILDGIEEEAGAGVKYRQRKFLDKIDRYL